MKFSDTTVALSDLEISKLNARAREVLDEAGEQAIDGLTESIGTLGLIQPIVVHPQGKKLGVIAGRRRYLAIVRLAEILSQPAEARACALEPGVIDFAAIPARLAEGTDAELAEASITENFAREPMSDIQIYRAVEVMKKAKGGKELDDEMLAQGFGVDVGRMRRILRLALMHPDVLAAYEAEAIDKRALMAFGATAKTKLQKEVLDQVLELHEHQRTAGEIRRRIGMVTQDQRKALRFAGDVYEELGGKLEADLFDAEGGRVLQPELLDQAIAVKVERERDRIRALLPDRELVFGNEDDKPKITQHGYTTSDSALRVPGPVSVHQPRMNAIDERINELDDYIRDLIDWESIDDEDGDDDEIIMSGPLIEDMNVDKERAEITALRAERKQLEDDTTAEAIWPENANLVILEFSYDGDLKWSLWYPSREAAGLALPSGAKVKPTAEEKAAKKVAEDPANPTLTQRAEDFIKAVRVKMAVAIAGDPNKAHNPMRELAHKALLYGLALDVGRQQNRYGQWGEASHAGGIGLVEGFSGDRFQFGQFGSVGDPSVRPDYRGLLKDIPGLFHENILTGWTIFSDKVTPKQLDLIAAVVFASKVNAKPGPTATIADEVFMPLAVPLYARRAWTPDDPFLSLFKKGTHGAWGSALSEGWKLSYGGLKSKADETRRALLKLVTGDKEGTKFMSVVDKDLEAAKLWVPRWLRWHTWEEIEAIRNPKPKKAKDKDQACIVEQTCPGHIASDEDPKICRHCGASVEEERPPAGDGEAAELEPEEANA